MSFNGSIDLQNKTSIAIHQPNHKKKSYSVIPNQVRERLINRILSKKVTIKQAADEFSIKFSTAKAILHIFRSEGRIGKKKTRSKRFIRKIMRSITTNNATGKNFTGPVIGIKKEENEQFLNQKLGIIDYRALYAQNFRIWMKNLENIYLRNLFYDKFANFNLMSSSQLYPSNIFKNNYQTNFLKS